MASGNDVGLSGSGQQSLAGLTVFDPGLDVFVCGVDEFVQGGFVCGFAGAELCVAHEFAGAFEEMIGVAEGGSLEEA